MKQFKRWLSSGLVVFFALLLAGSFAVPQAFAADMCTCFCGNRTEGAVNGGSFSSANECAQFCADVDYDSQYVGCFTDEAFYPENSNLCWTQSECETYPINIAGTVEYGKWGGQSAQCSKVIATGESMGYCHGPLIPVTLNVPIMGVTQIAALGDYVNLLYEYAIPLAGIFGALMFTLAGFQYMTAGGDKGAVSKAKARMTNTVIGIVLLMSVYTIAYLIDPRLTRFNELRPPIVKKAVIIDDATTCEAIFGYGFCINGTCPSDDTSVQGECGEKGSITGDDEVDLNIANPPKVGDTCLFSGCSEKGKSCVVSGDKSEAVCVACNDVSQAREATPATSIGLTPSDSVCSQIAKNASKNDSDKENKYLCYYDADFTTVFDESDSVGVSECVQFYTESNNYVDCTRLKEIASRTEDGCDAYTSVNADTWGYSGASLTSTIFSTGTANEIEDFKNQFGSFCEEDMCSLADAGTVLQGSCSFVDKNELLDDAASVWWIPAKIFNKFNNYGCAGSATLTSPSESTGSTSTGSSGGASTSGGGGFGTSE